jgi:hypothetical protein
MACKEGYVFRQAFAGDKACVTAQSRAQASADNQAATARRASLASDACARGYVWRQATPQDHVCVTPQARDQISQDNQLSASRIVVARPVVRAPVLSAGGVAKAGEANQSGATPIVPPARIGVGLKMPAVLPIPTHLASTTNPPTCTQHGGLGGGLACDALLGQGQLALIWNFKPNQDAVTGFHVYRVDGGGHSLVATQPDGPTVTVAFLGTPPAGGFQSACYSVAAYNSGGDGGVSAPFCPGAQSTLCQMLSPSTGMSMILCPQAMMTWAPPGSTVRSVLSVGGTASEATSQGLLIFDVPVFDSNRTQLVSARLQMRVARSDVGSQADGSDAQRDSTTSCVAYIFEDTNVWWDPTRNVAPAPASGPFNTATGPSAPGPVNIQQPGPNVSFDVTSIVTDWFGTGIFNFGFVLYGQSMPFGGGQSSGPNYCTTTYDPSSVVLVLQFS